MLMYFILDPWIADYEQTNYPRCELQQNTSNGTNIRHNTQTTIMRPVPRSKSSVWRCYWINVNTDTLYLLSVVC